MTTPRRRLPMLRVVPLALAVLLIAGADASAQRRWEVTFDARIVPTEGVAHVAIRLEGYASLVESMRFRIDRARHSGFEGDGTIREDGDHVWWEPPRTGGQLRYVFRIDNLRTSAHYDARVTDDWALFRGDHLVPPARIRTKNDAPSRSRLVLRLPKGWSAVTPYPKNNAGVFEIDHPHRLFDRPTGWMVAGKLGVLRERVAGTSVVIAGPVAQGIRRHDMLALLRWTLPSLRRAAGRLPERLVIVSAGDPMWRGGLSGPGSLYIHAGRPLISSDLTSPLLHEVVHVLTGLRAGKDGDWVVEGLADYYSLQALVRSRTVTQGRYERALAAIEQRGRPVKTIRVQRADGDQTARAVSTLVRLDARMRERSEGRVSLDDVVAYFAKRRSKITTARFRTIVEKLTGADFGPFFERYVP